MNYGGLNKRYGANLCNKTRHSYIYLLPIDGQTVFKKNRIFFKLNFLKFFFFFHGQRRALQLVIYKCISF